MRAKSYLQQIRRLDRKINNKQVQLESLRELVTNITPILKNINVQSNGSQDRLGDTMTKIIDLQNEINNEIDLYVNRKLEAIKLINAMEDDVSINILIQRYINYKRWDEIADNLNYTRQGVLKKHGQALLNFEKVFT